MRDVVFCLAFLFLLGWVVYLKWQVSELKEELEKMARRLKRVLRQQDTNVELGDDQKVWGQRPSWMS